MGKMLQKVAVDKTWRHTNRLEFLQPWLQDKQVLHVGFVDWPKTRVAKNLHLCIAPWCKRLDGIDPNADKAELLRVPNGELYTQWEQVSDIYDIILVPEVIEHVDNVADFFSCLNRYAGTLIITAPDVYLLQHHFRETENGFEELVHPDHNCWYSPYTLMNTINKFSRRKVSSLHWVGAQSIVAICQ